LVRYIHLNPLRARLAKNLAQLNRYRWSGHGVLMGKIKNDWQDRDYVLKWFGKKEGEAKKAYVGNSGTLLTELTKYLLCAYVFT